MSRWWQKWVSVSEIPAAQVARDLAEVVPPPPTSTAAAPMPTSATSDAGKIAAVLADLLDYVRDARDKSDAKERRDFYLSAVRLVLHDPPPERVEDADEIRSAIVRRHPAQAVRGARQLRVDGLEDREPRPGSISADETPAERDEREYQEAQREIYERARIARMNGAALPEDE